MAKKKPSQKTPARRPAKKTAASLNEPPARLRPGDPLPDDVVELFEKHARYLAAGRANYAKVDKCLEAILERCEPGVQHVIAAVGRRPPKMLTLVDQFAATNQVWAGASCKRMKIDEQTIKPQDR